MNSQNTFIHFETKENLQVGTATVYRCQFDPDFYHDELFEANGITLPSTLKNAVTKRRAEYFAGRYCCKKIFQQLTTEFIQIGTGENRNPIWPTGFVGSISHSNNHAFAAVDFDKNCRGIGLDVEKVIEDSVIDSIHAKIVFGDELRLIEDKATRRVNFTLMFSLKESFYKAAFPTIGTFFGFDAIEITSIDNANGHLTFNISQPISEQVGFDRLRAYYFQIDQEMMLTLVRF